MRVQEPPFFEIAVGSDVFILIYYRWDLHFTLEKDGRASQAAGADFLQKSLYHWGESA